MSELQITKTRFRNAVWEGLVTGAGDTGARPELRVTHQDRPVEGVELINGQENNGWLLRIPVPQDAIADGVQTFLICDAADNTRLSDFTLIAGEAVSDDIRAEVELLRAELDMLKRAFRRHCLETG
ncbi:MAG: hypothetical protein AB3N23_09945 [Paracoccaceae bacterium]